MNMTGFLITLSILMILYPFSIYFQLKSLSKQLSYHWQKIERLVKEYKVTSSEKVLKTLNQERRAYNALVRANDHKLESTLGKFLAKKYDFMKREQFEFKA